MKMKTSREIFNELWNKPKSEKFTPEEIEIIKKYVPKWKYKARYAIYKPVSKKDIYIGFFLTYQYKHIEHLVLEDLKYNVTTPPGFVKECKRLGYTGDFQLQMNFF